MAIAKGSIERFIESLTAEERNKYNAEYRELLISEMLIAAKEKDETTTRKLAKAMKNLD